MSRMRFLASGAALGTEPDLKLIKKWARENGIRISDASVYSRRARRLIPLEQIEEMRIERALLSPLVLAMPLISAVIGALVTYIGYIDPLLSGGKYLPWYGIPFSVLTLGYAGHTFWFYVTHRKNRVVLVATTPLEKPLTLIWSEEERDAIGLRAVILAAKAERQGNAQQDNKA